MSTSTLQLEQTEDQYIAAAHGGDASAFNWLVLRYQRQIYAYCLTILHEPEAAADAMQETFLHAFEAMSRYMGGLGTFQAWLYRIAHNTCIDATRRAKYRRTVSLQVEDEDSGETKERDIPDTDPWLDPESHALCSEIAAAIQEALAHIPKHNAAILSLVARYQGLTYVELAEATGMPIGTFKTRVRIGRAHLTRYLRKAGWDLGQHAREVTR